MDSMKNNAKIYRLKKCTFGCAQISNKIAMKIQYQAF